LRDLAKAFSYIASQFPKLAEYNDTGLC